MVKPQSKHNKMLNRLVRHFSGQPRVISEYRWQEDTGEIWGRSDGDWAGCRTTGESTSGGVIMRGSHVIKGWSSTQKAITLRSAAAELAVAIELCTQFIGIIQLAADGGKKLHGKAYLVRTRACAKFLTPSPQCYRAARRVRHGFIPNGSRGEFEHAFKGMYKLFWGGGGLKGPPA